MRRTPSILLLIVIFAGCGGKKNNPSPVLPPAIALLTAPAKNEVCTTGTVISGTASNVLFTWDASANTDNYDLIVKNLLTGDTVKKSLSTTQISLTLLRNTPFSWWVISKSLKTATTAKSETWKFYNAGPGVLTYAPFPAAIVSPVYGQSVATATGTINLSWTGSSVTSGTIVNYDVYFGTEQSPPLFKSAVTDSFVNNVAVTPGAIYYWKVITRDIAGDTSDTGVYQFTVN